MTRYPAGRSGGPGTTLARTAFPAALRHLRRRALTPPRRRVDPTVRGFAPAVERARPNLERAGHGFLDGYTLAMTSPGPHALADALGGLEPERRGFAYEGAGMALAVLDGMPFSHGRHLASFLADGGEQHVYLVHVGAGWALAVLPRSRWYAALRGVEDPVLAWLAFDGFGFHRAYFRTDRHVRARVAPWVDWPDRDPTGYARHAVDQGIGRALWFVEGADPDRVARTVATFPASRRADLYAGVGLAATYAAGLDEDGLRRLRAEAGAHAADVAQGSVFAAEARVRAGEVTGETERVVRVLTGLEVGAASRLASTTRPTEALVDGAPSYEAWRRAIREQCPGPAPLADASRGPGPHAGPR
ncbi:DUF1702 family protein [Phycicoccus flavus]|uniref:DUF1702 family protein n=1 Tax=Phycicoccus flavus TaxID=2502783 RepID=A0A8T6RA06_9MICO|nr:DUF1702 family protein [Phycicoccus flavus]NHA69051.1 DUF1702 family protein [Phycicoccus flavus]